MRRSKLWSAQSVAAYQDATPSTRWSTCTDSVSSSDVALNGVTGCIGRGHDIAAWGGGCASVARGGYCLKHGYRQDASSMISRSGCIVNSISHNGGVLCCKEYQPHHPRRLPPASPTGGCASSTGQTIVRSGSVSACQGSCSGHIGGTSCKSLCASGWRVCTGSDIRGASLKAVVGSERSSLPGCYAFSSMVDCNACWSTCTDSVSSSDVSLNGVTGCIGRGHD